MTAPRLLDGASQMANPEHVAKLLSLGPEDWNTWRREARIKPDLRGAVLSDPKPDWAIRDVVVSNFEGFDLSGADFTGAILKHARLKSACLRRANLREANLRYADLRCADLTSAMLDETNLTLANCHGATFNEAIFWETVLARTNLHEAVGLDSAKHGGPSVIDHRTLKRSGYLPDSFLNGLGLPPRIAKSMTQHARQRPGYASCFISYSARDSDFAQKLRSALRSTGVHCWLAEHDMRPGRRIVDQISEAVDSQERLLLILSEHSIQSPWVNFEIKRAREREKASESDVLFPISLLPFPEVKKWTAIDVDTGEDLARVVREFFVQDFSAWEDQEAFEEAMSRLISSLRKERASFRRKRKRRR